MIATYVCLVNLYVGYRFEYCLFAIHFCTLNFFFEYFSSGSGSF